MGLPATNNRQKGFSLIELMIAMFIIMISMLALLTVMMTSMRTNVGNDVRNTSVAVANQTAEALLALPITDAELTVGTHARDSGSASQTNKGFPNVSQTVRGFQQTYNVQWGVTAPSTDLRQVNITVSYVYSNQTYTYQSLIYKHRAI